MTAQQRRSEIVRARRGQRRSTTSNARASRNSATRQMPPMVSRRGMVTPIQQPATRRKSQDAGRRRVDVPLKAGNAEIRLPAVALPHVGWRALSFLMVIGLGLALFWMMTSPAYSATDERIQVDGINRVDRNILLANSGILNQPVFLISPSDVAEKLPEAITALESVEVSVKMNGTVTIEAVERVPVLTWDQEGMIQPSWVDIQGRLFPAMGSSQNLVYVYANDYPPVPARELVASAEDEVPRDPAEMKETDEDKGRETLLDPALVPNLLLLARSVPEGSQLIYDGERGFGWKDPTYEWMVYFGKQLDRPEMRLKIYQAIADMFENKQNKPAVISVEFIHAPYYRMEP
ncbi:MAG: cell division protein FtsQ/DivIB [Anaerolineales bacterium]